MEGGLKRHPTHFALRKTEYKSRKKVPSTFENHLALLFGRFRDDRDTPSSHTALTPPAEALDKVLDGRVGHSVPLLADKPPQLLSSKKKPQTS